MKRTGLFVLGTDTGVGKTLVSVGLAAALAEDGRRVAVMKPCETGDGDDAARLIAATGRALDPALVNPYRFSLPAAPEVAARREGQRVELGRIEQAYRALAADADFILVEGAGGLLVPFAPAVTTVELIARLDLPVLIVARAGLGTINHTLLTAEVARRRGLSVLGAIFCRTRRRQGPEERDTVATIVRHGELRAFGLIPWVPASARQSPQQLASLVRQRVQLTGLLRTLGSGG